MLSLAALAFGAACSQAADATLAIPGTRVTLDEVLFVPGNDRRYRFDVRDWRVCRRSDFAPGARLDLIDVVLNADVLRLAPDGSTCNVVFSQAEVATQAPSDLAITSPGCRVIFGRSGSQLRSARVTPRPFSAEQYEKCASRLGLFLLGFNGALVIADDTLFVPTAQSIWSTFPGRPGYVPVFQYLLGRCTIDLGRIEMRTDLPRSMKCTGPTPADPAPPAPAPPAPTPPPATHSGNLNFDNGEGGIRDRQLDLGRSIDVASD